MKWLFILILNPIPRLCCKLSSCVVRLEYPCSIQNLHIYWNIKSKITDWEWMCNHSTAKWESRREMKMVLVLSVIHNKINIRSLQERLAKSKIPSQQRQSLQPVSNSDLDIGDRTHIVLGLSIVWICRSIVREAGLQETPPVFQDILGHYANNVISTILWGMDNGQWVHSINVVVVMMWETIQSRWLLLVLGPWFPLCFQWRVQWRLWITWSSVISFRNTLLNKLKLVKEVS